jgi:NitT/TauT family transport system substrate-binding protein
MTIVLQEALRAVFYAPFYAALALDAYGEEGVEVRHVCAPTPAEAARGLGDGSVDVGWGGPMRVMYSNANDPALDLVCFCEVVTRDPFFLLGRAPRADFKLADLLGRRLATVSEVPTPWMCLQEDMRRNGLDPAKLDRVADSSMSKSAALLRRGEIDVVQLFQPFVEELVEDGAGHIWYAAAARGPTSYTCLYGRRSFLAGRRDECQRMVRALYRTLRWVHAVSGADIAAAVATYFPDVPHERLAKALDRYKALGIWGRDPILPRSGYERLRASLLSGGLIAQGGRFEVTVDNTLAERVIAENPPALARARGSKPQDGSWRRGPGLLS